MIQYILFLNLLQTNYSENGLSKHYNIYQKNDKALIVLGLFNNALIKKIEA